MSPMTNLYNRLKFYIINNKAHLRFLAIIFLIFFIPRVISLGADIGGADIQFWYPRSHNFVHEFLRGHYQETYQKYHPGVTVMINSGTTLTTFEFLFEKLFHFNPRYIPQQFTRLNFAAKFPLVLIIATLLTYSSYLLSKITNNKKYVYLFAVILSLEPFFLGISRFFHLTALSGVFGFASFISIYYYYFQKKKHLYFFILSAVFLGLGTLTKVDALIAGLINGLFFIIYEFHFTYTNQRSILKSAWSVVKYGLFYSFLTIFTFFILFPSMWVAPLWTVQEMIHDGLEDTAFGNKGGASITNIRAIFYPEITFLRSSPIMTISVIAGLFVLIKNIFIAIKKHKRLNQTQQIILWAFIYTALYMAILTIPSKTKDRYAAVFYPSLSIIGAWALYCIYKINKYFKYGTLIILLLSYGFIIYRYHPVYSFYYNDLIGGQKGIERHNMPVINRGEYYAQVAFYINKNDPDAIVKNVITVHRSKIPSFQRFFYGTTYTNPKFLPDGANADYMIFHPNDLYMLLKDNCTFIKAFGPRYPMGYDMLYLYKCEGINNTYKKMKN